MRRRVRRPLLSFGVLLFGATGLVACSNGDDSPDAKAEIEGIIAQQLPEQVRKSVGVAAAPFPEVNCVESETNRFDCVADVGFVDAATGRRATQSVAIEGTCDEETCQWQAKSGF